MSATLVNPPSAIEQFEAAGERVAQLDEKIWIAEKVDMPPLVRKVAANDEEARAALKLLRAAVAGWKQDKTDGEQILAELLDVVVEQRRLLREQETRADFAKVRTLAGQQLAVARQLSDAVEALPALMRQYDKLQQQQNTLAFNHMTYDRIQSIPRRDSTDLLAAKIGHYRMAGDHDSPRHRADARSIAELAALHIDDLLRRLT